MRALRDAGHEVRVVGPSFYSQTGFGGENRTIARLRRLLPGFLGELAELAYNVPAYRRLKAAWQEMQPISCTNDAICISSPARGWPAGTR